MPFDSMSAETVLIEISDEKNVTKHQILQLFSLFLSLSVGPLSLSLSVGSLSLMAVSLDLQ